MSRRRPPLAVPLGVAVLVAVVLAGVALVRTPEPLLSPECTTAVPGTPAVVLDPEQAVNATTIAAVGRRLGLPAHAVTIALATAMQESKLRNLSYGDRDSLGLFQQRPSQGWGTPTQVSSPAYAAAAFYGRLAQVEDWQDLPVTVAAQAVQRSAYPEAYGRHEAAARTLARATTGEVAAGLTCAHLDVPPALDRDALQRDAAAELGSRGLTATSGAGLWTAASWLVARGAELGVREVHAGGQVWTASSGTWAADAGGPAGLTWR